MMIMDVIYPNESYAIIKAALEVHKTLGCGFSEKVYQEAFEIELKNQGIPFKREKQYLVNYKGITLQQQYYADFVCFDKIIVELKALSSIAAEHKSQVINYLHCANMKLGFVINFGETSLKSVRLINYQYKE